MSPVIALLREGLLSGRSIALAEGVSGTVRETLSELGARVEAFAPSHQEEDVGAWARERAPLHAVIFDAGPRFGAGGAQALAAALEEAWSAVREVAVGALIDGDGPGKVILVGPRAGAGPMAEAARSGLESLARTLSVEWARYQVTVVMVAPGPGTGERSLAQLLAFTCSRGGEYLSGCRIELGRTAPSDH